MKQLVEVIAKALVNKPDAVVVTEEQKGDRIILNLKVDQEDTGKVIGRGGRIAKALRSVVKAAAIKEDLQVELEID